METEINASVNQYREPVWITQCISGTYSSHLVFVDGSNGAWYYFIIMWWKLFPCYELDFLSLYNFLQINPEIFV